MKSVDVGFNGYSEKSFFRSTLLKLSLVTGIVLSTFGWAHAQDLKTIKLSSPDKEGGLPIMKALSLRQSTKDTSLWSDKELSLNDMSNLLWAGNGINREDGKRTAASAQNSQDVDIFVIRKDGIYIYDAGNHALNPVVSGDHRSDFGRRGGPPAGAQGGTEGGPPAGARGGAEGSPQSGAQGGRGTGGMSSFDYPVILLLVSENARFGGGTDELKYEWGAVDAGLVGQNIMLFCSGNGLVAHPKAAVDSDGTLKNLLNLTDTQHTLLRIDVGYPK
jgi:hypothetical protein